MKRDLDLVRQILLAVEKKASLALPLSPHDLVNPEHSMTTQE